MARVQKENDGAHFREEGEPRPRVEVLSITHDEAEDEWEAE